MRSPVHKPFVPPSLSAIPLGLAMTAVSSPRSPLRLEGGLELALVILVGFTLERVVRFLLGRTRIEERFVSAEEIDPQYDDVQLRWLLKAAVAEIQADHDRPRFESFSARDYSWAEHTSTIVEVEEVPK